ncbi:hypothetical protein SDC9_190311 [bioreactor metagenome]|uniref:Uncharacterized protein n=1 Tax=bioreactor metagenome TaxID=1076179 RepID=A0A645I2Y9_9ZZZZ
MSPPTPRPTPPICRGCFPPRWTRASICARWTATPPPTTPFSCWPTGPPAWKSKRRRTRRLWRASSSTSASTSPGALPPTERAPLTSSRWSPTACPPSTTNGWWPSPSQAPCCLRPPSSDGTPTGAALWPPPAIPARTWTPPGRTASLRAPPARCR